MSRGRFVHIGFNFTGEPPVNALKQGFDKALDWMRYSNSCWILYTTTDLDVWRDRIRQTDGILPDDSFFLCEFNPDSWSGFMPDWVWDWLHKIR
jgi:hypothetical protein